MLCNKKLIPNQRYLFHVETCHAKYQFRANFLGIFNGTTLNVTKYTDPKTLGSYVSGTYSLPTSWIIKVEDLTDIVHKNDICLPDDVLLEIDGFV